jgi:phytoene dehydrogenase-like protein
MTEFCDTIIIGAGASGLALTHLLARAGQEVLCLEAHHSPGGSAGYFSRGKFCFDAGATTLSGLAYDGPLGEFFKTCELNPELRKIDPGIIFGLQGDRLQRFAQTSAWVSEQARLFKQLPFDLEKMWQKIEQENALAWKIASASAHFPPHGLKSFFSLIGQDLPTKLRLAPLMLKSLKSHLFPHGPVPAGYEEFLNEMLLISTQSTLDQVPALVGILGLSYPQDTWYPMGGMRGFFEEMTRPIKSQLLLKTKVIKASKDKDGFLLETSKGFYRARQVISSLPLWNTAQLFNYKVEIDAQEAWCALTGYYKIKLRKELPGLYHQVHSKRISHVGSHSLFFSLCPVDDLARCDGISQTLSVSTHIRWHDYQKAMASGRDHLRTSWDHEIQSVIHEYFGADVLDLSSVGIGDPHTFIKYTGRHQGLVGGLPHTLKRNFLTWPRSQTPLKGLYQIGDTTFPGQGIVGVIQGAINLAQRLNHR